MPQRNTYLKPLNYEMSSRTSTSEAMKEKRNLVRDPEASRTDVFHSAFSTLIASGSRVKYGSSLRRLIWCLPGKTFHILLVHIDFVPARRSAASARRRGEKK
jgi:hypothetical protein